MKNIVSSIPLVALTLILLTGCEDKKAIPVSPIKTAAYTVNEMFFNEGVLHVETDRETFVFDYYSDAVFPRGQQYEVLYMGEKKIINIPATDYDNFIAIFEEQRAIYLQTNHQN